MTPPIPNSFTCLPLLQIWIWQARRKCFQQCDLKVGQNPKSTSKHCKNCESTPRGLDNPIPLLKIQLQGYLRTNCLQTTSVISPKLSHLWYIIICNWKKITEATRRLQSKFHRGLLISVSISKKKVQGSFTLVLGLNGVKEGALVMILEKVKWFLGLLLPLSQRTS